MCWTPALGLVCRQGRGCEHAFSVPWQTHDSCQGAICRVYRMAAMMPIQTHLEVLWGTAAGVMHHLPWTMATSCLFM